MGVRSVFVCIAVVVATITTSEVHAEHLRGLSYSIAQRSITQSSIHDQMLSAVNAERAKQGLKPVCFSSKLQRSSQLHSEDQARSGRMSHVGSSGSSTSDRINAQGFKWSAIAENVAAGQPDVAAVMKSWMNSPGHRRNILGDYSMVGFGVATNKNAQYKIFWTQDFGKGVSGESCEGKTPSTPSTPAKTPKTAPRTHQVPTNRPPKAVTSAPVTPGTVKPSPEDSSNLTHSSIHNEMLAAVNSEREKQGLKPLCFNNKLQKASQLHSEDQARTGVMSHTGSTGSTMSDRLNAQGFQWIGLAENVAAGQQDVAAVMNSWMNSDGHRRNILGDYTMVGFGVATNNNARYKIYWTQDFGKGGSGESCDNTA